MRTWCVGLALLASCGRDVAKTSDHGSAAPPVAKGVAIFVDDQPVATVDATQLAQWPRLDTIVPVAARRLGQWQDVALKGTRSMDLSQPSASYPELVPAVFPGAGGDASFGMFDPVELAKHGKPTLQEDGVTEIRIKLAQNSGRGEHEQGQGGGADPTKLAISVKTPKGTQVIDGTKLLAIPRQDAPGSGGGKGWPLTTILEAAGVKTFDKLVLTDAAGTNLNLDKSSFDATTIPFVKLNRQGQLRFRVFKKQGDGWQAAGDLRELTSIEVVK